MGKRKKTPTTRQEALPSETKECATHVLRRGRVRGEPLTSKGGKKILGDVRKTAEQKSGSAPNEKKGKEGKKNVRKKRPCWPWGKGE